MYEFVCPSFLQLWHNYSPPYFSVNGMMTFYFWHIKMASKVNIIYI